MKRSRRSAAGSLRVQTEPRPAWMDVVLIVRAPNDGSTILEWDKRMKKHGLVLEEIMTPEAWERRNTKPEKKE